MRNPLRIAMLVSGGGTTMQAIIQACRSGRLQNIEPVCVIASRRDAGAIEKALALGMRRGDVLIRRPKNYLDSEAFGETIIAICQARGVDFIGQYGWMEKTPPNVIEVWRGMMVNQHPGPLDPGRPDFGGKGMFGRRVHCARLYFVRTIKRDFWTEATAQRVAIEYDRGALLRTRTIEIREDDDTSTLQERVLPQEHELQIEVLDDFANRRVKEFSRQTPLVFPGEEAILEQAKRIAKALFPKG